MLTRIGDTAQSDRLLAALQASSSRIRTEQLQASTGKRASSFDEISGDASLLLRTREQQTLNQTYLQQNQQVVDRLNAMDGALSSLGDIANQVRTLLTQRLDASSGSAVPLGQEVDTMLSEVASQLNLRLGDRYLFAGSKLDTPPVQLPAPPASLASPSAYYKGDDVVQTVRADQNVEVPYGVTADNPAFASLIGAMDQARTADRAGDRASLQSALDRIGDAVSQLAGLRGQVGAVGERLNTITDGQQGTATYLDDIVSRIEDADVPQTMSRLAQDQANLEAAYLTTSRLSQLSLADYLR